MQAESIHTELIALDEDLNLASKHDPSDCIARAHRAVDRARKAAEASAALASARRMSIQDTEVSVQTNSIMAGDNDNRSAISHRTTPSSQPIQSQGPQSRLTEAALLKHRQRSEPGHRPPAAWRRRGSGRFDAAALPFHCSAEYLAGSLPPA